ncbi:MAG: hypothetical protein CMJ78_16235 [Planctomycetaceae bacterium]|nr:hypothetical protein [Planctomycetaceae bacterium]
MSPFHFWRCSDETDSWDARCAGTLSCAGNYKCRREVEKEDDSENVSLKVGDVAYEAKPVGEVARKKILKRSRQIDALIGEQLKENQLERNARASDAIFVRRVYLDVVGRIASYSEAREFLDSDDENKRAALIDKLLDSEGYVSHHFNYFADLLRLQSRMRYAPAHYYLDFVKNSLRTNKPYDKFVRELITSKGYTWDNGAAGYYLRDTGMPLDNMSNTVQVFLGTQLVCAQCHNHPFDSWTQKQYYQLAAFTYGVETRDRRIPQFRELQSMRREGKVDRMTLSSAGQLIGALSFKVNETERSLRLPKDYQYEDAKPLETIDPKTIFGDNVEVRDGDSNAEIYARWMTSPKNPRFATVIANRLWKRAFGLGVVEPVDDFKDGIDASNPELMAYLSEQMIDLKFDMKQYLRMLLNTETYQAEVSVAEVTDDDTYHFPGPILRRASAEQIWDSLLTLAVPELDDRKGVPQIYNRYAIRGKDLVEMEMDEVLEKAEELAKQRQAGYEYYQKTRELSKEMRVAYRTQDRDKIRELQQKMAEIRKEVYGEEYEQQMQMRRTQQRDQYRETDPRWMGLSKQLVRASELPSPAQPGHFLRQFGQSDRETIENANTEANVPQILTMLNGPLFYSLVNRNTLIAKNLTEAESRPEKLDVIFLSILSRRPTERETELAMDKIAEQGTRDATGLMWALINTHQFLFIQ